VGLRAPRILSVLLLLPAWVGAAPQPAGSAEQGVSVEVQLEPRQGTVGDPLELSIEIRIPPGLRINPPRIGPELGPFGVLHGGWDGPQRVERGSRWNWSGTISAFRTGRLEFPAIEFSFVGRTGRSALHSQPIPVEISSVLAGAVDPSGAGLADLKPPASVAPDYHTLWLTAGSLLLAIASAALLRWLKRRYADRLRAVAMPLDPFRRTAPDVWLYAELQKLLARRLAEDGRVDLFYEELSRLLKTYLGGRYRVDLRERTSGEVPGELSQAGVPIAAIRSSSTLLDECDGVKFAGQRPGPEAWRDAVERIYGIVDSTRPPRAAAETLREGAA